MRGHLPVRPVRPPTDTRGLSRSFRRGLVMLGLAVTALVVSCFAQDGPAGDAPQAPAPESKATFFEHSQTSKWWFSGQANIVFQAHGDFYAQYSGTNSLHNKAETATSRVLTFFSGYEFNPNTVAYLDVEESGGKGLSTALGLAAFTNLDVVRNPSIGAAPYIARLMMEQIIPLSKEKMEVERTEIGRAHV